MGEHEVDIDSELTATGHACVREPPCRILIGSEKTEAWHIFQLTKQLVLGSRFSRALSASTTRQFVANVAHLADYNPLAQDSISTVSSLPRDARAQLGSAINILRCGVRVGGFGKSTISRDAGFRFPNTRTLTMSALVFQVTFLFFFGAAHRLLWR